MTLTSYPQSNSIVPNKMEAHVVNIHKADKTSPK